MGGKEGVVFWVDSEKRHGKIISLDECELQLVSKKSWEVFWSSTENAEKSAWGVDVDYGVEICLDVTLRYRVRAVSAF